MSVNFFENSGLKFEKDGDQIWCVLPEATQDHSRFDAVVSGGLISTMLDAHMGVVAFRAVNRESVTSLDLSVRFLRAAELGDKLISTADILKVSGRTVLVEGRVSRNGDLIAVGHATYMRASAP